MAANDAGVVRAALAIPQWNNLAAFPGKKLRFGFALKLSPDDQANTP